MTADKTRIRKKQPEQNPKYLLVVGSDTGSVVYTSMLLQRLDYHICTAANAETALQIAQAVVPSLIISDLKLSGMSAAQMIKALRKKTDLAEVPVVIKLEDFAPKIVQKCLEAGAAACIKKPVDPPELFRVVQSAVEATPREHIRIKTHLSVVLNDTPLDFDAGECATMLSAKGMYVRTSTIYPAKTKLPVQIRLNGKTISTDATVVYSHAAGQGPFNEPGMGLYFKEIAAADQECLQQYINAEVTQGLPPEQPEN